MVGRLSGVGGNSLTIVVSYNYSSFFLRIGGTMRRGLLGGGVGRSFVVHPNKRANEC